LKCVSIRLNRTSTPRIISKQDIELTAASRTAPLSGASCGGCGGGTRTASRKKSGSVIDVRLNRVACASSAASMLSRRADPLACGYASRNAWKKRGHRGTAAADCARSDVDAAASSAVLSGAWPAICATVSGAKRINAEFPAAMRALRPS